MFFLAAVFGFIAHGPAGAGNRDSDWQLFLFAFFHIRRFRFIGILRLARSTKAGAPIAGRMVPSLHLSQGTPCFLNSSMREIGMTISSELSHLSQ